MNGLSENHLAAVYSLVADLRLRGFAIGADHYLRLESLLTRIERTHSPAELKTLLCPLFATDGKRQEEFYQVFARHFPPEDVPPASEVEPPENGWSKETARGPRWRLWIPLAGVLLVAGFLAYLAAQWWSDPVQPGFSRLPRVFVEFTQPTRTENNEDSPEAIWPVLLPGLFLLLLLIDQGLRYRRRKLALDRARQRKPPFSWPIRARTPEIKDYRSDLFFRTARLLRQRRISDAQRLDILRSIAATIEARGFPTLRTKPDSVSPEYLVLVHRVSFRDHQARLFEQLAKALKGEGLFLEIYFYDTDSRVCSAGKSSRSSPITELQKRFPEHRLLLLTEGEELLDPISGELAPWVVLLHDWRERAILTPREEADWGIHERTLEEAFVVLPATVLGMSELANRFELSVRPDRTRLESGEKRPPLPVPESSVSVEDLRSHLGEPSFQWLCACAVYPELHWDMTLSLGALPAIGKGFLREEPLLRLARLPWFRRGSLPDELRLKLIEQLDAEHETEIRHAVVKLLGDNPARPGSFAASSRQLQILAQNAYLARDDRKAFRRVLRQLRDFPQSDIASDRAFLRLLEEASVSRLVLRLPAEVRRILFERGVPTFGLRTAASTLGALAIAITLYPVARGAWETLIQEGIPEPRPQTTLSTAASPSQEPQIEPPAEGSQDEPPTTGFEAGLEDSALQPRLAPPDPKPPINSEEPTDREPQSFETDPTGTQGSAKDPSTKPGSETESSPTQQSEIDLPAKGSESESSTIKGSETNPLARGSEVDLPPTESSETAGPSKKGPEGETPEPVPSTVDLKDAIVSTLSWFQGEDTEDDLFLAGNIPQGKLARARKAARVPEDEEVIALIDDTIFGGGKISFIFGRRGVYYNEPFIAPGYIPYEEFARTDIRVTSRLLKTISFGEKRKFSFSGTGISAEKLARMFNEVKSLVSSASPPPTN